MSVIEKIGEAICEADPESGSYCWMKYGKSHYVPMARAALQCLSANIDAGGLKAAARAFVNGMGENDGPTEDVFKQASAEDKAMFIGVVTKCVQAYLNTISKE